MKAAVLCKHAMARNNDPDRIAGQRAAHRPRGTWTSNSCRHFSAFNIRQVMLRPENHADESEEVFSTLMGDVVEPRREFIQANALNVANLDV